MALRSVGCQTCRSRRIKCDGNRPVCQRCTKAGRTCHGMSDGTPIVHLENAYASGKLKRPRGPRSMVLLDHTEHTGPISRHLDIGLESVALSYYMDQHLQSLGDAPNLIKGIADEISPNWTTHSALPLVRLAVSSIALAIFARTQYHPQALLEASQKYHQALRSAQGAFRNIDEDSIDKCLLVIFFMGRYEDAVHNRWDYSENAPLTATLHSMRHHDGAMATLSLWKNRMKHTRPASDVIKHIRRGLLRSAIIRNIALPVWIQNGASFGERGLALEYDQIVVRTISIRQKLSGLLAESNNVRNAPRSTVAALEEISQETKDIDTALQRWATHFPESWVYTQHVLPPSFDYPTEDLYSSLLYTYSSYTHAAIWNHYYAMRMLINNTRLKIPYLFSHSLEDDPPRYYADSLSVMENMADSLAASIPYCLQKALSAQSIQVAQGAQPKPYVGSLTVWPLTIASSLTFLNPRKRAWFRLQLTRYGKRAGYGVLEESTNGPAWLEM